MARYFTKKGISFLETNPSVKIYAKKGDNLEIGAGKTCLITYDFWKNKLFSVTINFEEYNT
jgi:hypothetical protein